ncbi:retinal dehydrogenase 2 [Aspergillus ochraceoroseus]|uniref:Retinal dehydrogenase 2 n=1 Tax=Aspergillus ochraceoroseus TaxID=138278 RepID=A0A0F8UPW8_9EURO|nr:retinal dehydrogenase 2 [Aspergillus ochraceoroseus]
MADISVQLTAPNGHKYTQPIGLFINNQFIPSKSGEKFATINPSDESEITSVYAAGEEDIDIAVKAARKALKDPSWKLIPATDRGVLMLKLADLVEQHKETLATIETWDNGKPYQIALSDDVSEVVNCLRYCAGWADKIHGQTISTTSAKFAYTLRQPIGVVGQIIPWNFPLAMAAWKLGPALACGNTVVLKPAEQTPLSILYLATLIKEAGFPPGVVNILNGFGRVAGTALVTHTDVDKVAFTGSTMTGKEIMKMAAGTMKNVTLETGGKSPLLVFEDADIEQAAKWAHIGIMYNQGQVCTATSRILVHESVYDKFVALFKEAVTTTSKVGDPFADDTFQGPQVTKDQYERVLSYVQSGKDEGATLVSGGNPHKNDNMRIYREEVFGPFAVICSFSTEEEAVTRANDTTYGLGAAVFTKDIERAHRVAADIEAGMVWINSSNDSDFRVPFGGVKQSGIGRELGEAGLEAYSHVKAVHVNLGTKL